MAHRIMEHGWLPWGYQAEKRLREWWWWITLVVGASPILPNFHCWLVRLAIKLSVTQPHFQFIIFLPQIFDFLSPLFHFLSKSGRVKDGETTQLSSLQMYQKTLLDRHIMQQITHIIQQIMHIMQQIMRILQHIIMRRQSLPWPWYNLWDDFGANLAYLGLEIIYETILALTYECFMYHGNCLVPIPR